MTHSGSSVDHLAAQLEQSLDIDVNRAAGQPEEASDESTRGENPVVGKCEVENGADEVSDPQEQYEQDGTRGGHPIRPGIIDPSLQVVSQYPPGIRQCVELEMVTISQEPRLSFTLL
jgi:hypothetical protein